MDHEPRARNKEQRTENKESRIKRQGIKNKK